jgi:SAM-dependent methyltransferase
MGRQQHWNTVYTKKDERDVSWFEDLPEISLKMLEAAGLKADSCVVDIGGGDSRLVDSLRSKGLDCLAVLDVSAAALERAKNRLREDSDVVTWIEADVTGNWFLKPMDIWHDRAVFHFLVDPSDRDRYVGHLRAVLKVGGTAVVATFNLDGPEKCSGLPVQRYSAESLARQFGNEFELIESLPHVHQTPWGTKQSFQYSRFTRTV